MRGPVPAGRAAPAAAESTPAAAGEADRLRAHVERLAGEIGERNVFRPGALEASRAYIEAEWIRQGYAVTTQWHEAAGRPCANLDACRPGGARPDRILVIGAHYDSVMGSPGANDNASGVAALLEISRRFAGRVPGVTVRFAAFVNEEPPFFATDRQGSAVYARAARGRGDDIRLMVSLETIGCYRSGPGTQGYPPLLGRFRPDRGDFIAFVSDFRSRALMRRAAAAFRAASDFPLQSAAAFRFLPGISWSDHLAFWRERYRAFMVTDTALYRYPHYHSPDDTPDKLAYPELARVTDGLFRALAALADGLA